ncbi:flagellar filament capping protein FliD [Alkalibacter mobilis]|uniref:flagellar filament capping protein FliD n=1 Tax=Alkalibacter mobilis TaxID=2787712 RepID=UPI00189C93F9|nr:flagellar filament capping protein FliD [Alkalibacter mobilis]MBF7096330.1 flagellar filament capping protein FliD [Alkalibacter mobilis]
MSTINFMGSYSGIDQTTIDQLMAIEKRPLVQLSDKKVNMENQKNAWNDVRTRLSNLFDKIKVLQDSDTYTSKTATVLGESADMTVSKNTPEGVYKIAVSQLATNTSVIGGEIALADGDSNKALGVSGSFYINGSTEIQVDVADTVQSIAEKINNLSSDSGVKATIIDNRLILENNETGSIALDLTDNDGITLDALGLGVSKSVVEGKNSKFNINGVDIERTTNSIKDVVAYTTINLTKEHQTGDFDTVTVSQDKTKLTSALDEFVKQYNSTIQFISDKLDAGEVGVENSRGDLAGDATLMRLQSTLRNMVTSKITNLETDISDLSQLGITTIDKYGQLQFDQSKLNEMTDLNPEMVQNFFFASDALGDETGFVPRINSYLDGFVSTTGIIKGKTDTYDRSIREISKQVDDFNLRMERKEQYYINMFSKLDTAMMEAESQMSWLTSQISSLTASVGNNK